MSSSSARGLSYTTADRFGGKDLKYHQCISIVHAIAARLCPARTAAIGSTLGTLCARMQMMTYISASEITAARI